jgi:hypothetical protein
VIKRASLLFSFLLAALVMAAFADDGSIVITASQTSYPGYGNGYPDSDSGYAGYDTAYPDYSQSPDSVQMYKEYYTFDLGGPSATGPGQYGTYGSAPTYLVINGQTMPYDPSYVSANSLWIEGKTSWTQYIKCPLGASYRVLAVSNGGPATMVETYPTGYQQAKQYNFYSGYTPGVFEADKEGRHTLAFYLNGQKSNSVIVDVVPYSGNTFVNNPPSGQTSTKTVIIGVGTTGQGSGQPQGKSCDITGTWNFGTNGPYNIINADGTIVAKQTLDGEIFDSGTWNVIDAAKRQYGFTWQSGWAHTFTLSADCSSLDGYGRLNGGTEQPGHATRVTSVQSGGYSTTSTGNLGPAGSDPFATGGILIDSADEGFDPNAHIGDMLTDSAEDMGFPSGGEMI